MLLLFLLNGGWMSGRGQFFSFERAAHDDISFARIAATAPAAAAAATPPRSKTRRKR